jgi:polyphosphate kinase
MDMKLKTDETAAALPHLFLNRELSLLEFNRRVLEQAEDPNVPLLERLRFLCIVSSNLDEFFEVRVASLLAQYQEQVGQLSGVDDLSSVNLDGASDECREIIARQYALLNDAILPQLSEHGIHLLRRSDRNAAQKAWVKQYFDQEVRPLLTPIGLDPAHPFPRVINKSLNFIVELAGKDA